jgi:hypothetical protein
VICLHLRQRAVFSTTSKAIEQNDDGRRGSKALSDARSITVGFLGVLFPLSGVEEPPPLAPLRAGTFALAKEKITTLAKHNTY